MQSHARFLAPLALAAAFLLAAAGAHAKIVGRTVEYEQGGKRLEGYLAYDDAHRGKRPGVLVIHEWWGLNDYIRHRARELAQMGYVAFAADMYGDGRVTTDPGQAGAWSGEVRKTPGLLAERSKAGLEILKRQRNVDTHRIGAIGFCFGGSTVLALAYSGEPLQGVVTFHGSLFPPAAGQAQRIRAPIVILQGEDDPFVKPETIAEVKKGLDEGGVDWYMVTYAHAMHAFTNPDAGKYGVKGVAYDAKAARRSWQEMRHFFDVQLKGRKG